MNRHEYSVDSDSRTTVKLLEEAVIQTRGMFALIQHAVSHIDNQCSDIWLNVVQLQPPLHITICFSNALHMLGSSQNLWMGVQLGGGKDLSAPIANCSCFPVQWSAHFSALLLYTSPELRSFCWNKSENTVAKSPTVSAAATWLSPWLCTCSGLFEIWILNPWLPSHRPYRCSHYF